jgi:hypothetical protein
MRSSLKLATSDHFNRNKNLDRLLDIEPPCFLCSKTPFEAYKVLQAEAEVEKVE